MLCEERKRKEEERRRREEGGRYRVDRQQHGYLVATSRDLSVARACSGRKAWLSFGRCWWRSNGKDA
jgi:hypothetical protein